MKRYVMLEDKEIVDTKDMESYIATDISKESDNLLDLLEVGDCMELEDDNRNIIFHLFNQNTFDYAISDEFCDEDDEAHIVAIWKRNGDVMRRYEI